MSEEAVPVTDARAPDAQVEVIEGGVALDMGAVAVAQAPAVAPGLPTYFLNVHFLSPRLGVTVAQPFTVKLAPYFGGDYLAQAHFFPTQVAAHSAGAALDGLMGVLVNRLVRFHKVRDDLTPDLYDEYRALTTYLTFL